MSDTRSNLAFINFLKRRRFTLLLGPSNSGKTSWFIDSFRKHGGAVISVVDKKDLCPLDRDSKTFFGTAQVINIRHDNIKNKIKPKSKNILIDEIHCFRPRELVYICKHVPKSARLYISMLPGSFSQDPLPNTAQLVSNATDIIILPGICQDCGQDTMHSQKMNAKDQSSHQQIVIGKSLFVAKCRQCS